MRVLFVCPICQNQVPGPPSLAGNAAPCPHCNKNVEPWPAPIAPPPRPIPPTTLEPPKHDSTASQPKSKPFTSVNVRVLTIIGAVLCVIGGLQITQAGERLLRLPEPRNLLELTAVKHLREELIYQLVAGVLIAGIGVGGLTIYVPTVRLKETLAHLRPLVGRTKDEVSDALKRPQEIERLPGGRIVLGTWKTLLFSITLEFTDEVCTTVVREKRAG